MVPETFCITDLSFYCRAVIISFVFIKFDFYFDQMNVLLLCLCVIGVGYSFASDTRCTQDYPFFFRFNSVQHACCAVPPSVDVKTNEPVCPRFKLSDDTASSYYENFTDNSDRFCECDQATCNANTFLEYTQTTFEFGPSHSYLPKVNETFLEFVDAVNKTMQAKGCNGPQSRVEGAEWYGRNNAPCGCKVQDSLQTAAFLCNPYTSCAYEESMTGERGIAGLNLNVHTTDSLECREFTSLHHAEQWCVYEQKCVGLLQPWDTRFRFCIVTSRTQFAALESELEGNSSPSTQGCSTPYARIDTGSTCFCCVNNNWIEGPCLSSHYRFLLKLSYEKDSFDFEKVVHDTIIVSQGSEVARACNTGLENDFQTLVRLETEESKVNWETIFQPATPSNNSKLQAVFSEQVAFGSLTAAKALCQKIDDCTSFYYLEDEQDQTAGYFFFKSTAPSDAASGTYHKYEKQTTFTPYRPCPTHVECDHGSGFYDRASNSCMCRCDAFWSGQLCDECTSQNRQADCINCLPNFVTSVNDMCICASGYDIRSGCSTCLPGITGAFCQTDKCKYTFAKTVDTSTTKLQSIVIAYNSEEVLYDGVKSAGYGRVPASMVNTFVLQHRKLWWLHNSTRHFVMHVSQEELQVWTQKRNVHRLTGEWLYSIAAAQSTTLSDIISSETFTGHVCQYAGNFEVENEQVTQQQCASLCASSFDSQGTFNCASWHFDTQTSKCGFYSENLLESLTADFFLRRFLASEYVVDVRCVSGGFFGAGLYRNLPNQPSLAEPDSSETLQPVPASIRSRFLCAYDDDTVYVLSEYRRHRWTGDVNCNDSRVQLVQFTWLYSLPRGKELSLTSVREEWWNEDLYPSLDTVTASEPTAEQCAERCNADVNCGFWVFNDASCFINPTLQHAETTFESFGGVSAELEPLMTEESLKFVILAPKTFATETDPQLEASVSTRQDCCEFCSAFEAWSMSGAHCSCFGDPRTSVLQGTIDDVKQCRVPSYLEPGKKCSMTYEMNNFEFPIAVDPVAHLKCTKISSTYFLLSDETSELGCKKECLDRPECDMSGLALDITIVNDVSLANIVSKYDSTGALSAAKLNPGLSLHLQECSMYYCPNLAFYESQLINKYNF